MKWMAGDKRKERVDCRARNRVEARHTQREGWLAGRVRLSQEEEWSNSITLPLTARYPHMARQGNVRAYLRSAAGRRTTSGPASCTVCAEGGREGGRVSGRGVNGGQPKSTKQALLMLVWAFGLWGCVGRGGRARLARLLLVRLSTTWEMCGWGREAAEA